MSSTTSSLAAKSLISVTAPGALLVGKGRVAGHRGVRPDRLQIGDAAAEVDDRIQHELCRVSV